MKSIFTLVLILSLVDGPRAFAHAGHGDEPFAQKFAEFAATQFKVRPLPAGEPTSYVLFRDGRRVDLDSKLRAAVQRMAGSLGEVPESEELYRDVRWREWTKYYAQSAVANVKHLFSRGFVLELAGSGVQGFYRFGALAATIIIVAEITEHLVISPILPGVPLCQAVYAGCAFFARETQEFTNAIHPQHLKPLTLAQRLRRWVASRDQRREVRHAMKNVYRAGDDANLSRRAKNRSYRDASAGAEVIYGSFLNRGFFRDTLADPAACEECADDHGNLNYGRFARAKTNVFRPRAENVDRVEVPVIDDLARHADESVRVLKTEEYIAFVELIFEDAQLAAGDLTRATEGPGKTRVPLRTTARKTPGFLALHRDLARMRKSLDLYAFGLRMRAFQSTPRSAQAAQVDHDFAAALGTFVNTYNARLKALDEQTAAPLAADADLRVIPDVSLRRVREWMRSGVFCDGLLTAGLLESPAAANARAAPRPKSAAGVEGLFDLFN